MQPTLTSSALAFALSLAFVAPATAQGPSSPGSSQRFLQADSSVVEDAAWIETLDEQLAVLLESGDPERQSAAMTLVIELRRQPSGTQPSGPYDFTECISPLLRIYRSDQREGMRLLALAALHEIGTRRVYDALRASFQETRSERVRRQTALVLHYAEAEGRTSYSGRIRR
ncbi:MAG: hypothetical protein BRD42_00630 [Bacteroidetes bacterium QS_3_64_15]|nr:MAG: hypothetical protein BRD42_00630 [Bacteroidetes bacterium QS_3_64_15]